MKVKLAIITEVIAPYRIPVFNVLARHPQIDLHVIFLAQTDPSMRKWHIYSDEMRFSYEVLPSWRTRMGKYNLLLNRNVAENLHAQEPDVLICGGYNYLASWQAQRWSNCNQVPFILWCESTANDQRNGNAIVESLKQTFFCRCDGFVVPGKSAGEYVEQMAVAAKPTFVAPNAVDNELFRRGAESARLNAERLRGRLAIPSRYFLFVGRLVKAKGVLDLIHAYGQLPEEMRLQVGLIFAGDGPLRAEAESLARTMFPGIIQFAGFVHRDELSAYYGLAECLVFASHSDTWGLVVNEAMACGLPVICSQVAGCAADLIASNGILVQSRNVSELSDAMKMVANSPAMRERMSHDSQNVIRQYSPELCAAGIAEAALAFGNAGQPDATAACKSGLPATTRVQ